MVANDMRVIAVGLDAVGQWRMIVKFLPDDYTELIPVDVLLI